MKIERVKNSKRNVFFGLINKSVMLILPFIIRTLILKFLSSEYVGLSSLFTSVLSVLNLTELGFGSALVFSMYKPLVEDDTDTIRALLNFFRKVYRIIGCLVIAIGLCLLPFIKLFIFGDVPSGMNVYILFGIYIFDASLSYFVFPQSTCVFSSQQRNDIESNILTSVYTVMYICQIIVLCVFKDVEAHITYYVYIILQPVFNIILNVAKGITAKKLYPEFYCKGQPSKELVSDIKGRVKALFGHKLGTVVLYSLDSIVVSAFLGLSELAVFNNYYMIHASVLGLLQVGYNAVKAGIGNSMVTDDKEKNYTDFKKLTFMNSCIVGWCTICLLCLYNRFMYFWVGGDTSLIYDVKIVIALCVYFYLNSMRWIVLTYKDAAGVWKEDAVKPYVESAVNLIFNIILIQTPLKVTGVIISSVIAVACVSAPWETSVLFKSYFKKKTFEHYLWYFIYTAVNVAIAVGTYFVCRLLAPGYEVKDFIIRVLVLIVLPAAAYALIYFKKKEFKQCAQSLLSRIKKV